MGRRSDTAHSAGRLDPGRGPSLTATIEILRGLRDRYEAHHQFRITDEALSATAEQRG